MDPDSGSYPVRVTCTSYIIWFPICYSQLIFAQFNPAPIVIGRFPKGTKRCQPHLNPVKLCQWPRHVTPIRRIGEDSEHGSLNLQPEWHRDDRVQFYCLEKDLGFLILRGVIEYQPCCCHGSWHAFSELIGPSQDVGYLRVKTRIWKHTTTQFEVDQCHRQTPLIFYFPLFQLGVRITIHHYYTLLT